MEIMPKKRTTDLFHREFEENAVDTVEIAQNQWRDELCNLQPYFARYVHYGGLNDGGQRRDGTDPPQLALSRGLAVT